MGSSRPMTWDELVGEIRNLKQQLNAANEAKELAEAGLAEVWRGQGLRAVPEHVGGV